MKEKEKHKKIDCGHQIYSSQYLVQKFGSMNRNELANQIPKIRFFFQIGSRVRDYYFAPTLSKSNG
jgi:hypothetical protein